MSNRSPCYGNMFPDFLNFQANAVNEGRVITASATRMGVGVQERKIRLKEEAWEECVVCPDYRTCYDLSRAKLAVASALHIVI